MDTDKLHERAIALVGSIPDNISIHIDNQIRSIMDCSAGFHDRNTPLKGRVVLWAQWQHAMKHAVKIKFTPTLKIELLHLAVTQPNGGIRKGLGAGEHAGLKVDVVFIFEYEKDVEPGDQLGQIRKSKYEHEPKDLWTIMEHRLLKQC